MNAISQAKTANLQPATHMKFATIRNGLIFALCFYGALGVIVGLIWG